MEDEHNYITVGTHRGDMDFGISGAITELTYQEMNELRIMTMVAIGQAESMWRNAQDKLHPSIAMPKRV